MKLRVHIQNVGQRDISFNHGHQLNSAFLTMVAATAPSLARIIHTLEHKPYALTTIQAKDRKKSQGGVRGFSFVVGHFDVGTISSDLAEAIKCFAQQEIRVQDCTFSVIAVSELPSPKFNQIQLWNTVTPIAIKNVLEEKRELYCTPNICDRGLIEVALARNWKFRTKDWNFGELKTSVPKPGEVVVVVDNRECRPIHARIKDSVLNGWHGTVATNTDQATQECLYLLGLGCHTANSFGQITPAIV